MSGKSIFQIAMSDFHSSNTTEKLILLGLVSHADPDGGNAFPSKAKLAHYAGCNPKTVQRALKRLRDSGSITQVESDRRDKAITASRRPTAYRINSERFAHFASWEKEQGGHPDDPPSNSQTDSESQKVGGHPDVPSRGDTQMSPDHTSYLSTTTSLSSPPLSLRSSGGVTSFTEAQSARGAGEGEEDDDQGREGEDDSTSITDPDDSSITADSVPLSGHDASSEQARGTPSEPGSSQVEESPTGGTGGPQNGVQPLQNPEGNKPKHFTWRPHPEVWEQMETTAPDIDLELVLSAYITWCIDNRKPMNNSQWSSWVEKRQGRVNDQKREEEEKRRREESMRSNWTKKNGWHL